ncbi:MAG: 4-hydroxy-3-methylbut-2-enyl diphosphate reductase [Pseudomonadota bacterium]
MADAKPELVIYLAAPRGFCAGVDRAILIVDRALQKFGAPVYVRHEIVHNRHVVAALEKKGAVFVDTLDVVPDDRPVIFSAHGVAQCVFQEAQRRDLHYIDATCPLVSKVHNQARHCFNKKYHILLIGHRNHPEVIGTMGQLPDGAITLIETTQDAQDFHPESDQPLAYISQTTLSVDDTREIIDVLQSRFPLIMGPTQDDICYATTNRQKAVAQIVAQGAECIYVLGSQNSSNSQRLVEVALANGAKEAHLIDDVGDVDWGHLSRMKAIGITAGASAPEHLVQEFLSTLRTRFAVREETISIAREAIEFKLPASLRN